MADFDDIDALLSSSLKKRGRTGELRRCRRRHPFAGGGRRCRCLGRGCDRSGMGRGRGGGILTIVAPPRPHRRGRRASAATLGRLGVLSAAGRRSTAPCPRLVRHRGHAPVSGCPDGPRRRPDAANTRVSPSPATRTATGSACATPPTWSRRALVRAARDIAIDEGAVDPATLPVGDACPEPEVMIVTPTRSRPTSRPGADRRPRPEPEPAAGRHHAAGREAGQRGHRAASTAPGRPRTATSTSDIVVTIADNVGVTNITATQSHPVRRSPRSAQSGTSYTYRFTAGVYSYPSPDLNVTVTSTAKDAAGNTASNNKTITIYNTCLI